jgi:ribose transport system substrate-binding protein
MATTELDRSRHCELIMNPCTKRSFLLWGGWMLAAGLTGCSKSEPAPAATGSTTAAASTGHKAVKLAFVTNGVGEFWKIASAGVHAYEKEGKVQVDIKMPPTGAAAEQNAYLEDLISQGYDAIALSVIAPDDQVGILNRVAAKAKLITFDSDAPKSNRLLYIGTNNYEAGKKLGAEIVKMLPNGGEMAVFVGTLAADNAQQRFKGIEDVVTPANIKIVERREDGGDRGKARSNVEDVLNSHHNLGLVAGLYSYNGSQIASALEGPKKGKVKAAVFDEEDGTLAGIEAGSIDCTAVQKPYEFGYLASKWMHALATKPDAMQTIPANKTIDTGVDIIDKTNVAAFKAKLTELKK